MKKTDILDVISRKLAPFILLFGMYLITYGHLSPGGGFQGGVVLASGVVLLLLCQGTDRVQKLFPLPVVNSAEALGFLAFLLMGFAGVLFGGGFLSNFLPVGKAGEVPGAGFILILNLVVGLKVGAGITLICFYLFKE
ncbi:MAG TPA: sodium:proton antiporter [bacterium]|nr:sodium:proton antiporter [bacterium]